MGQRLAVMTSLVGPGGTERQHGTKNDRKKRSVALSEGKPVVSQVTMSQQRIERDHQHLKGRTRSMRGFQTLPCAQVICTGHGFMRNLRSGCYDLGVGGGEVDRLPSPRLVRAWDELTLTLAAA